MITPILPKNELDRLLAVDSYAVLDTAPEEAFDNLTELAAAICGTPISLITFLDESRQWFKSAHGLAERQTPREISFCGHAIHENNLFEIQDAMLDERFKDNPLVTQEPYIRFYAGMPLQSRSGHNLGTLCVIDHIPHKLNALQRKALYSIGKQVASLLEHRKSLLQMAELSKALEQSEAFYNALLNSADESIISTTPDGLITTFNIGAEDMLGYKAEELIGKATPEILHDAAEVEAYAKELSLALGQVITPGFEVFVIRTKSGGSDTRKWTYIRKDGSKITVNLSVTALFDNQGLIIGYLGVARDITDSIQTQQALVDMSSILERTGEIAKVGGWEFSLSNQDMKWTKEVFKIHEIDATSPPLLEDALNFYPPEAKATLELAIQKCIDNGSPWDLELPFVTAKKNQIWVRAQGALNTRNGKPVSLVGTFQDITIRKKTALDLIWLNRALHMLSKANQALAQINNEKLLILEICRIAVDIGGYKMAWVGYLEDDEYKTVSPQGHFGQSTDSYIKKLKLSWSDHGEMANGPASKAIRLGKPVVVDDVLLDTSFPVRELATEYEYRSVVVLPLKNKANTIGMLALYSHEVRNISNQEISLLQELVENLQMGIHNIKIENDAIQLTDSIIKVASSINASNSTDFFMQLLSSITNTLKADAGYIAKLLPVKPLKASMLAVSYEEKFESNFDFVIAADTSKSLFEHSDLIIVNDDANIKFPQLSMMKFHPFKAFAGLHLRDSNGDSIGLIFVCFKHSIESKYLNNINSILKIFAARTVSELERLKSDSIIQEQASMLEKAKGAIVVQDLNHHITFWNKGAEELYGWTADEVLDKPIQNILKHDLVVWNKALSSLLDNGEWEGEITEYHKNNRELIIEQNWTLFRDSMGKPKSIFLIKSDVTHRKLLEEKTRLMAFYDPLTSLPNRRLLIDRLEKAISLKQRDSQFGAILFIDLDNFKKLNDTLGHDKGDQLLKEVAKRLTECVRASDTVSRLGGDEFVIFADNLTTNIEQAKSIAIKMGEKVLTALNYPFDFNGYLHYSTPSIGIALFNKQAKSTDEILKNADTAMYQSKTTGRNKLTFFDDSKATQSS